MAQRVALARAMVIKPDLMLFDEPLSNLDAKLRVKMRVEIRRIQQELGFTAIYVTHDQEECFAISDKVAIMNKGVIEQMDAPSTIYNSPNTEFIARFVGFENFFDLTRAQNGVLTAANGAAITVAEDKAGTKLRRASVRRTSACFRRGRRLSMPFPARCWSARSSAGQSAQCQDGYRRIYCQCRSESGFPDWRGGYALADGK